VGEDYYISREANELRRAQPEEEGRDIERERWLKFSFSFSILFSLTLNQLDHEIMYFN